MHFRIALLLSPSSLMNKILLGRISKEIRGRRAFFIFYFWICNFYSTFLLGFIKCWWRHYITYVFHFIPIRDCFLCVFLCCVPISYTYYAVPVRAYANIPMSITIHNHGFFIYFLKGRRTPIFMFSNVSKKYMKRGKVGELPTWFLCKKCTSLWSW